VSLRYFGDDYPQSEAGGKSAGLCPGLDLHMREWQTAPGLMLSLAYLSEDPGVCRDESASTGVAYSNSSGALERTPERSRGVSGCGSVRRDEASSL